VVFLRQLGSGFEGHPNWLKVPGVEVSSGSLGQGLGAAVSRARAFRSWRMKPVGMVPRTAPKKEQFEKALPELLTPDFPRSRVDALLKRAATTAGEIAQKTKAGIPRFARDYWWNASDLDEG
jgi:Transketolase, thiamine diphosphate binding domain